MTPDPVAEFRLYCVNERGMTPEDAAQIPSEFIIAHLANDLTLPSLYEVVEGRRRADQQEEPEEPGYGHEI